MFKFKSDIISYFFNLSIRLFKPIDLSNSMNRKIK